MSKRILIADDHGVVRAGLKQILADELDGAVFGEATNATETLEQVWKQDWDLVLLDINMPGSSGVEILKQVRHDRPKLPVLILSIHPEDQFAERTLKAGAAGYLVKDFAPEELARATRKVLGGGKYVSAGLAERLAASLEEGTDRPPHQTLSDREYEILRMIATGKPVKQIGIELSLSVKTVSTYRTRVLRKMRLTNNAELIRYAIEHHLVG